MLSFAVGPVLMEQEILDIGSQQIPYFRTNEFSKIMLENENLLKEFVNASSESRVIFLTASGTAAMEASIMNLFTKNDKVLVVNGGSFGKRFKEICDIHEINSEEINLNYSEILTKEKLDPYENKGFTGLLINVHETSTGVLYDMDLVKDFCKRNNLFLVVDAISSFLADKFDMQGVNAVIISSQKALALPPGLSFIIIDDKAQKRALDNGVKSIYFGFKNYLEDGKRGQTPFTPAVSTLIQLNKRLKKINEVGLGKVISEVEYIANDFRNKISGLPLEIASSSMSNALTPLRPKGKMAANEIFEYLKDNYDIFICPNGGDLSKKLFRVGHIGNIKTFDNETLINALKDMHEKGIL